MKLFYILLIAGFMLITAGYFSEQVAKPRLDLPTLVPNLNSHGKNNPMIKLYDKYSNLFFCSGVVVAKNYALTAGHCLEGRSKFKPSIKVYNQENKDTNVEATAVFYDSQSDQGLIQGDFSSFNSLSFITDSGSLLTLIFNPMVTVATCGYPYGGSLLCTPMIKRHQVYNMVGGQGLLYPGMSGGPVLAIVGTTAVVIGTNYATLEDGIVVAPTIELLVHAKVKVTAE